MAWCLDYKDTNEFVISHLNWSRRMLEIPKRLRRYFADSTLTIRSFESRELCIHIEKDIGPESGVMRFRGVSFMSIPDCFSGDGIDSIEVRNADELFWEKTSCYPGCVDPTQMIYRIHDQEDAMHFVVADSLTYEVDDS